MKEEESIYSYQPRLKSVKYLQGEYLKFFTYKMFFIDNRSKIRLLLKHNFIDQIGQNVQIMKRTYKSNHLYEVYSTLTCYKLKDNPTGSSNWLVSGKSHFQIKWQSWKTHDS